MAFPAAVSSVVLAACVLLTGATALDNGLGRTPPLGWSSWNYFASDINEVRQPLSRVAAACYKLVLPACCCSLLSLTDYMHRR